MEGDGLLLFLLPSKIFSCGLPSSQMDLCSALTVHPIFPLGLEGTTTPAHSGADGYFLSRLRGAAGAGPGRCGEWGGGQPVGYFAVSVYGI